MLRPPAPAALAALASGLSSELLPLLISWLGFFERRRGIRGLGRHLLLNFARRLGHLRLALRKIPLARGAWFILLPLLGVGLRAGLFSIFAGAFGWLC